VPRRLAVAPHPDPDGLRRRARAAPAADRARWPAVRPVAEGRPATEVGPLVGFPPGWVRALVRRSGAGVAAAPADGRRGNAGAAPLLDAEQRAALRAAPAGPAPGGGIWTRRAVAAWIGARAGRPVAGQRGWGWLVRLGSTPPRPRPREERADPAAQDGSNRGASRRRSTP